MLNHFAQFSNIPYFKIYIHVQLALLCALVIIEVTGTNEGVTGIQHTSFNLHTFTVETNLHQLLL